MVLYEIFSHSDRFHYRANLFSFGTCFLIVTAALTVVPPFLWTYFAGGFWVKESRFVEQARVNSSIKYLLWIETSTTANAPIFCSSYVSLVKSFRSSSIPCSATLFETRNDDGALKDQLTTTFDVALPSSTTITKVDIWIILQYELRARERIIMETMVPITLISPGSNFPSTSKPNVTVFGDLIFEQRKPIQSFGQNTKYNVSVINDPLGNFTDILDQYFQRDFYTIYRTESTTWKSGSSTRSDVLTINIKMNVKQQSIRFIPGFWQEFKWAWIQYLSAFLPFVYLFNYFKEFVFRNQFVRTTIELPRHRCKVK